MIAEMMDSPILDRYIINLQWGRDPMIAETRHTSMVSVPKIHLQWGRDPMTAEICAGCLGSCWLHPFNGAAVR